LRLSCWARSAVSVDWSSSGSGPSHRTLDGNVEIRLVDLAFDSEGTVPAMLKREGEGVKTGEVIATLDDATYRSGAAALAQVRRDAARRNSINCCTAQGAKISIKRAPTLPWHRRDWPTRRQRSRGRAGCCR
jgi:multidrug efflux pump subunit AcrA (membrane-fusion protein)